MKSGNQCVHLGVSRPKIVCSSKITPADITNQFFGVGDDQGFYGVRFFLPL